MASNLTSEDIVKLMQAAAETGVTRLTYGTLTFETVGYRPAKSITEQLQEEIEQDTEATHEWMNAPPPGPILPPESM